MYIGSACLHHCRKKLSKFSQHPDWRNASNYVAKRYMKEAGRQVYFQDVKLQMDAKLWGEEYNKHRPPKKVLVSQGRGEGEEGGGNDGDWGGREGGSV